MVFSRGAGDFAKWTRGSGGDRDETIVNHRMETIVNHRNYGFLLGGGRFCRMDPRIRRRSEGNHRNFRMETIVNDINYGFLLGRAILQYGHADPAEIGGRADGCSDARIRRRCVGEPVFRLDRMHQRSILRTSTEESTEELFPAPAACLSAIPAT